MTESIKELKKKIEQKNIVLNSFSHNDKSNKDDIRRLEIELDGLLYQYYKQLRCS